MINFAQTARHRNAQAVLVYMLNICHTSRRSRITNHEGVAQGCLPVSVLSVCDRVRSSPTVVIGIGNGSLKASPSPDARQTQPGDVLTEGGYPCFPFAPGIIDTLSSSPLFYISSLSPMPFAHSVPTFLLPSHCCNMSSVLHRRYTTLILDLGDVLFRWSPKTKTPIPPRKLKEILSSVTWFEYERGQISQSDCYERAAAEFNIEAEVIAEAFKQARESLGANEEFITLIRELRRETNGQLTVLALSNISLPDYEYIMSLTSDWTTVFDRVFPSALIGERKPHLGCYRKVISEMNLDPHATVFVDDKLDNVASARSLGMHGIVFDNQANVFRQLRNIFGDPVRRGRDYLASHAGKLESVTDTGVVFEENFTQLLIYELTDDKSLIKTSECPRTWNFFRGKPLFSETFPDDVDTTSVALTVLRPDRELVLSVLDEMLNYVDADGIMQTYFDHSRPRMDPFVCVNVLSLFYEHGRGHELPCTLDWVYEVLLHRAYHGGSRYYMSADCFLFFMSRLLQRADDPAVQSRFRPLFIERVNERIGAAGDSMDLAFRILAAATVGIECPRDMERLIAAQGDDGGWDLCWFYQFGSTGVRAGNRGLSTALAIKAIVTSIARPPSPAPSVTSSAKSTPRRFAFPRPSSPLPRISDFLMPWRKLRVQGAGED